MKSRPNFYQREIFWPIDFLGILLPSRPEINRKSHLIKPFNEKDFKKKSAIKAEFFVKGIDNFINQFRFLSNFMDLQMMIFTLGEGTLERPMAIRGQQPKPPPRMDSYRIMHRGSGTGSRSASGSEIYERLPADTGSLGDDLDDRLRISCSDEDEDLHDSDMYILNQRANGSGEHLVKPSQLKAKSKNQQRPPLPPSNRGQQPPPGKSERIFRLFNSYSA